MKKRLLLRVMRAAHEPKLTQTQVARKAGMGIFRYWQIENAEGQPASLDERKAIAAALEAPVGEIAWPEQQTTEAHAS